MQNDHSGLLLLIFGGIVPYLLLSSRPRNQLLCEQCGFVFRPVRRPAGLEFAFVVLIVAVVIAVAVYVLTALATQ